VAKKGTGIYQQARDALEEQAVQIGVDFSAQVAEQSAETNYRAGLRFLHRLGAIQGRRKELFERRVKQIARHTQEELGINENEVRGVLGLFGSDAAEIGICTQEPACEKCPFKAECQWAKKNPRILDMPLRERPRERLINEGADSLSDADLIGIIIRDGQPNRTAVDLARLLISRHGSLRSLANKTIEELCEIPGIGEAKAAQIKAALTIGIRMSEEAGLQRGDPLSSSEATFRKYHAKLRDKQHEEFYAILLDRKHRVIQDVLVSVGSLTASIVHPREVFNHAVSHSAAAIVCVHNHPSGDPGPSRQDLEITKRLKEAGLTLGIPLLDHLIIGDERYFSFADAGLLK
jgi:DNA repair protein RadC